MKLQDLRILLPLLSPYILVNAFLWEVQYAPSLLFYGRSLLQGTLDRGARI